MSDISYHYRRLKSNIIDNKYPTFPNMHHQEFESPETLQDSIACFWHTVIDFNVLPSGFEVTPDGYAEIIFCFGCNCNIEQGDGLQMLTSPFMVGLLNKPIRFYTDGLLDVIGVRCFPWTVFDLLGLPASKSEVKSFEHPIALLQSDLAASIRLGKVADAIDTLRAYFLKMQKNSAADGMLFKAGAALLNANGAIPVSKVAKAAHATVRTLERRFKQSSGHGVKDVSALMRFEQVRNRLWHQPDTGLAGLAQEMGYADQAHMSRAFKRYTGTTPAAFARKTKKNKETFNNDFVAFLQG